jgi:2-succinyl-5-enolpyruvyl-6-hydroxy-3-cyclohexene-1-carboxylate synthase
MAEHGGMQVWMHVDERSAAFFALGMAKTCQKPVALVCSSGTAVANYLPAVIEACYSRIPLLLITADRPHELRAVGAPQTIDQIGIFGHFVKLFVELAEPESSLTLLKYARTVATRAAATASCGPRGPVHLNFPFREPLVPDLNAPTLWQGRRENQSCYTQVLAGKRQLDQEQVEQLAHSLQGVERGLIVCGPHDDPLFATAVVALAERLHYPILADSLSQLRSGSHNKQWVIDTYDSFLRDATVVNQLIPEVVIRFGAMPVSKALLQYLQKYPACRLLVIDEDEGWREPTLLATDMIYASPVAVCQALSHWDDCHVNILQSLRCEWGARWLKINAITKQELVTQGKHDFLSEGQIFMELSELLPAYSTLFVGNGMPVRDLDTFFFCNDRNIRIMANRGANGIDGVVSTALGVAVSEGPCLLVLGDLSFYHDLNGLLAAKLYNLNATIILINNDGGGIFSFLPQAQCPQHFEQLFGTPLGLDFKLAVEMYQGEFSRVDSWEDFQQTLQRNLQDKGLHVIEVATQRDENVQLHREIWQAVSHVVQRAL